MTPTEVEAAQGPLRQPAGFAPEWINAWRQRVAELHLQLETELRFANSYNRAGILVDMFQTEHPRRIQFLGNEWDGCDRYPPAMRRIVAKLPRPALDAMSAAEQSLLASLPEIVTVWRGCYEINRKGMSWTLDRAVAEKFPTLNRYSRDDEQPLLLEGRIRRDRVAFLKLAREEQEIVCNPGDVRVARVHELQSKVEKAAA